MPLPIDIARMMASHAAQFIPPYEDRFTSCWELFALTESQIRRQQTEKLGVPQEGDHVVWGVATSSVKTYKAALLLAGLGHGTQAVMLDRSLIENALITHWADAHREEAVRLMDLHSRHVSVIWRELFEARELDLTPFAHLSPFTEEEEAEIRSVFGRYATRSWTGHTSYDLHQAVRDTWVNDNEKVLLDHVVAVNLRYANLRLHSSATSTIKAKPVEETMLYDAGESSEDIPSALLISFWALTHTLRHLLVEPLRQELMAFYWERMPTFFRP